MAETDMRREAHGESGDDTPWPDIRARPRSFFGAPLCTDLSELSADIAFVGMPFDQGTFGRPGARYGPDGIREFVLKGELTLPLKII